MTAEDVPSEQDWSVSCDHTVLHALDMARSTRQRARIAAPDSRSTSSRRRALAATGASGPPSITARAKMRRVAACVARKRWKSTIGVIWTAGA